MARVKSVAARRHREVKKQVKGYKHSTRKRIKTAKEAILHAGQYAYVGRKLRKRDMRKLWIIRLNAAVREKDLSYSRFIDGLKKAKIEIDRKILSDIAINDQETFTEIVDTVKKTL